MIKVTVKGNFNKTESFLKKIKRRDIYSTIEQYAIEGVRALSAATPYDSGVTSRSWDYKIEMNDRHVSIEWYNTNTNNGVPIVILLQYGHATRDGGYVQGQDFINPAIRPIMDKISDKVWEEVMRA